MIKEVQSWLRSARSVAVLTGAGMSAESGVPTFRGENGLWRNYRPEDLATPEAFERDPKLVWEWYDWRRGLIAACQPHEGHRALVLLEERTLQFLLITQNVDGLHERAGSRQVRRLHGSIWILRCTRCGDEHEDLTARLADIPPHCACGGMLRPGVVWFGETLPEDAWRDAQLAAQQAEVFLVVGTSAVVQPAASLALIASNASSKVVEVNPDATPLSSFVAASLRGPAGQVLSEIIS